MLFSFTSLLGDEMAASSSDDPGAAFFASVPVVSAIKGRGVGTESFSSGSGAVMELGSGACGGISLN